VIRARGLVKRYGRFTAVDGIDLAVNAGEIYGFLGPNGAGKTSTIMMLLGITPPTSGEIRLFGEPFTERRLDLRARIGVVPEKHPRGVWHRMTVLDYLGLFADLFNVPNARRRIAGLLERVDLDAARGKRIRDLSHGMLQKLSITRALLHDPDILFLDEPISGLDPLGIRQVRNLLAEENRGGRTIFISSHQLSEMERLCHRVGIVSRGTLLAENTMDGLLGRVSAGRQIHVELESVPDGLVSAIEELPFVSRVQAAAATLVITVPAQGDYRKGISELLIGRGLVPLRIEVRTPSLEEAFVLLTQENVVSIAAGGSG
jgi:ABC-2 type transport system ATP-binding protein